MISTRWLLPLFIFISFSLQAQEQSYQIGLIGFYNLENLFDTLDTPGVNDTEFTPSGPKLYGTRIYQEKLDNLTRVVAQMGTDLTPDGISILGVSEIENRSVLEDFVAHPRIADRNYQIVHYDSPDRRGVDVGLIYNPKYFTVTESRAVPLMIYETDSETRIYTRDVLLVGGDYDGDPLYIMVNHWPSRRGGEAASAYLRNAGALLCKNLADSIQQANPAAKIIIMGDLNDDPTSPSVAEVLQAKRKPNQVRPGGFFNPMWEYYRQGLGTLAYRDAWNLFDQLIINRKLIDPRQEGYHYYQSYIFNPSYLVQKTGHFRGYPLRTYSGDTYLGGFSDHFPVYMALIKPQDDGN
ncbi:MAG: endonuclease/exonuclease/phosphatase family protein [Lewinella sp.]|nr:endonuclease/exonuclease/phosphatase family protein [Lewinella sp.]